MKKITFIVKSMDALMVVFFFVLSLSSYGDVCKAGVFLIIAVIYSSVISVKREINRKR